MTAAPDAGRTDLGTVRTVLAAIVVAPVAYAGALNFWGFTPILAILFLCGSFIGMTMPMSRKWEFLPNAAWGAVAFIVAMAAAHFTFLAWLAPKDGAGPTSYDIAAATALFLAGVIPAAVIAVLCGVASKGAYLLIRRHFLHDAK